MASDSALSLYCSSSAAAAAASSKAAVSIEVARDNFLSCTRKLTKTILSKKEKKKQNSVENKE